MNQTRVMFDGKVSLEGEKVGTLTVGEMVARRPQPRYRTTCTCGCVSTESHDRIASGAARCRSTNHNRVATKRERLQESLDLIAQRQAELEAAQQRAAIARLDAGVTDYERPSKYAPAPQSHQVMTERERIAIREFRESEEAAQREAERPAREKAEAEQRRIAQLTAEQERTLRQLHAIERERVANGKDDQFFVDPATIGEANAVPPEKVAQWQAAQFAEFLKLNQDYYKCDENAKALTDYIERNVPGGLVLLSAVQLTAAYKRLNEYGLLKQKPAPKPLVQPTRVNLAAEPAKTPDKPQPVMFDGWDEEGNPTRYDERTVSKWSSETMKRRLRLTAASGALTLPNVGPGPKGYGR